MAPSSHKSALTVGAAEKAGTCMMEKTANPMLAMCCAIFTVVMFASKGLFPNPLNSVMSCKALELSVTGSFLSAFPVSYCP